MPSRLKLFFIQKSGIFKGRFFDKVDTESSNIEYFINCTKLICKLELIFLFCGGSDEDLINAFHLFGIVIVLKGVQIDARKIQSSNIELPLLSLIFINQI